MPFETLNVRIPHKQKRQLKRHAALLEITPSELVRRLLAAGAARFQPVELGPTGAVFERCPKCRYSPGRGTASWRRRTVGGITRSSTSTGGRWTPVLRSGHALC